MFFFLPSRPLVGHGHRMRVVRALKTAVLVRIVLETPKIAIITRHVYKNLTLQRIILCVYTARQ